MKKIINDPSTVLDEMNRGFATAYADIVELHDDPLHPYTAGLVGARPHIDGDVIRLSAIPGRPRSAYEAPAGCAFNDRCAHTDEACRVDRPELVALDGGLVRCVHAVELRGRLHTTIEAEVSGG